MTTIASVLLPVLRTVGIAGLVALYLPLAGCGGVSSQGKSGETPATREVSAGGEEPTDVAPAKSAALKQSNRFAIELAMGAKCGDWTIDDPPLQEPACAGKLPAHLAEFVRNIPASHPHLTAAQREEAARIDQRFRAVQGYGDRPDFVAMIWNFGLFWIRSFEGPDPETTMYMVYGPDCVVRKGKPLETDCLEGAPATIRDVKLYRVDAGSAPRDVTFESLPAAPRLTAEERRRYGVYLRPHGEAEDADIGLDVSRLAFAPVMRWVIDPAEEGDYQAPRIPESDPRGFRRMAHFGFLVWDGQGFELRDRIQRRLWACGLDRGHCLTEFDYDSDPYLDESVEPKTGGNFAP